MADFGKGKKKRLKRNKGASWKILGVGMKGATGLREILLIAFFSLMVLLKLTETHQISEVKIWQPTVLIHRKLCCSHKLRC